MSEGVSTLSASTWVWLISTAQSQSEESDERTSLSLTRHHDTSSITIQTITTYERRSAHPAPPSGSNHPAGLQDQRSPCEPQHTSARQLLQCDRRPGFARRLHEDGQQGLLHTLQVHGGGRLDGERRCRLRAAHPGPTIAHSSSNHMVAFVRRSGSRRPSRPSERPTRVSSQWRRPSRC